MTLLDLGNKGYNWLYNTVYKPPSLVKTAYASGGPGLTPTPAPQVVPTPNPQRGTNGLSVQDLYNQGYSFTPGSSVLGESTQNPYTPTPTTGAMNLPGGLIQNRSSYTGNNNNNNGQVNTINQNSSDLQSQADYEFEQALNYIGQQEGAANQRATADISAQEAAGTKASNLAQQSRETNLQGLSQEQATAETQAGTGLRDARDLFRQIQQSNIAQLSGLGISSSSVSEALAERLGVETARRIAGISGSLSEVRQNIEKERTRVNTVYQQKLGEIKDATDTAIGRIRANLSQQLADLGQARGQAAIDKARARTDIVVNARNQVQQIQNQAYQANQAVEQAAAKRDEALNQAKQFMFQPTDFSGMQNYINKVSELPSVGGLQAVPSFQPTNVYGQGFLNPSVNFEQKKYQNGDLQQMDGKTYVYLNGQWQEQL